MADEVFTVGQRFWRLVDWSATDGGLDINGEWQDTGTWSAHTDWEVWEVKELTPEGCWVHQVGRADTPGGRLLRLTFPGAKWCWVADPHRCKLRLGSTPAEAAAQAVRTRKRHIGFLRQDLSRAQARLTALEQAADRCKETS